MDDREFNPAERKRLMEPLMAFYRSVNELDPEQQLHLITMTNYHNSLTEMENMQDFINAFYDHLYHEYSFALAFATGVYDNGPPSFVDVDDWSIPNHEEYQHMSDHYKFMCNMMKSIADKYGVEIKKRKEQ